MVGFSASDAAFTGFRVVREHPTLVLFWALLQLAVSFGFTLLFIGMMGPAFGQLQSVGLSGQQDPVASLKLLQQMGPLYLVLLLLSLAFYAIIYAAMNRAVLRPTEDSFGYLRLGADELRQLGLMLLLFLLFVGVYIATLIATIILAIVLGIVLAAVSKAAASAVIVLVLVLGFVCVFAFLGVRMSLASAQTFATGRINLFGSWTLTKGHFWPMLGAYLLTLVLLLIMGILALVIMAIVTATIGGGFSGLSAMFMRPDTSSIAAYLSPARIVYLVLSALFSALFLPVWLTPPAAIYQALTAGRETGSVAAVFS